MERESDLFELEDVMLFVTSLWGTGVHCTVQIIFLCPREGQAGC